MHTDVVVIANLGNVSKEDNCLQHRSRRTPRISVTLGHLISPFPSCPIILGMSCQDSRTQPELLPPLIGEVRRMAYGLSIMVNSRHRCPHRRLNVVCSVLVERVRRRRMHPKDSTRMVHKSFKLPGRLANRSNNIFNLGN